MLETLYLTKSRVLKSNMTIVFKIPTQKFSHKAFLVPIIKIFIFALNFAF